jgi:hypothetical protein
VHRAGGNIAAFTDAKRARRASLRQRHFAVEDDVRSLDGVRVVRIKGVRSVLPDVRVKKSFPVQLAFQRFLIGGHFLHRRNRALHLVLLRAEDPGGNSRYCTAWNYPNGFRTEPILEARNHRSLPGRERRKPHVSDLLCCFRRPPRVIALPRNLKKLGLC